MDNENDFQAELDQDLGAEMRYEIEQGAFEKMKGLAQTLEDTAKDLRELIATPAFTLKEGKIYF